MQDDNGKRTRTTHSSQVIIHLLLAGQSVCGKPKGRPSNWPTGHLFVEYSPSLGAPPVTSCPECLERAQRRLRR